jgi:hypothetical protein
MDKNRIKNIYKRYKDSTNMSYDELKKWKKNPCSKKASIGDTAINRNLNLLSKPSKKWDSRDAKEALKTISFNARMSKVKAGKKVKDCNLSKRTISLKNWALDPNKDTLSKNKFKKYPYVYEVIKK